MGPLMAVPALAARFDAGQRTVVLDVRWALGDPHGREHYLEGHLPGAVFVDLATELATPATPAARQAPAAHRRGIPGNCQALGDQQRRRCGGL